VLSKLALNCEPLNRLLDGNQVSKEEAYEIFRFSTNDNEELLNASQTLRNKSHGKTVTFSKKAFFNKGTRETKQTRSSQEARRSDSVSMEKKYISASE